MPIILVVTLGGNMEAEIRSQPRLLAEKAPQYLAAIPSELKGRRYEMVLIAARGSSDHAALYARYLIEIHLGIPVSLAAPSVLTRYGTHVRYTNCLAIGISQSGAAPDVAEVLSSLREAGHGTIAITNTPGSRITEAAETTIQLDVGVERSVAATKTYTASLLALYQLVRALGAELPDVAGSLPTEAWLERNESAAADTFGVLARTNPVLCLARGYSYCTAQETALKLMECALIPAKSYSTADFQHGPRALAGPGSSAVTFGPGVEGLEAQGCQVLYAPPVVDTPYPLAPISEIIYGQWLSLYAARGRGLNPDDPQHIQKVTLTR